LEWGDSLSTWGWGARSVAGGNCKDGLSDTTQTVTQASLIPKPWRGTDAMEEETLSYDVELRERPVAGDGSGDERGWAG
jgi:hypothetical protein